VDATGSAYVTGTTNSDNFPTYNAVQPVYGGGFCSPYWCDDAFVTKLSANGSSLVYSTYLGGSWDEGVSLYSGDIAVDPAGQAYVTGVTASENFPVQNAFQGTLEGGNADAFVTKLSAAGSTFIYSTYLGGSAGFAIAADATGNACVTGLAGGSGFPTTPGAFQTTSRGDTDAFVTKFIPDGSRLAYSTFLGGSGDDHGLDIALDAAGNATVSGQTAYATDFPTWNAFQPEFGGGLTDAIVTKFVANGSALVYSSFLGGSGIDTGFGMATDKLGHAYVVGGTNSTDFPTVKPFQPQKAGSDDAFVSKVSPFGVEHGNNKPGLYLDARE
jgi:beta-propeller repeat-containing protein